MDVPRSWVLLCLGALSCGIAPAQEKPVFSTDIQPILKSRCFACHGDKLQLHGLRLDRKADALKGGESGVPAITPGDSAKSLLIQYVAGLNKDIVMPPAGPRLTPDQVALLRNWIDRGAEAGRRERQRNTQPPRALGLSPRRAHLSPGN